MKRLVLALLGAAACAFGMWQAVNAGRARTLAHDALAFGDLTAAENAVRLAPKDAEAHNSRGILLQRAEDHAAASQELERAIQLRPRDYFPWMLLGISRDLQNDQEGAARALRIAIALSPVYARSHWLLGNLLLRMNQPADAFQELRLAAVSDQTLWPNVIDLAWGFHRGDAAQTMAEVQPQTDEARLALATFFAGHHQPAAALTQFRAVSSPSAEAQQNLIRALLSAGAYAEAYTVWANWRRLPATVPSLLNPDFEAEIALDNSGFGWQIASLPNVVLSADPTQFHSGTKSLRIDFHGDSPPDQPAAAQLIVLYPQTSYRLTFHALAKDFVSTGVPVVVVAEAAGAGNKVIAQSPSLSAAKEWREFSIDFTTGEGIDSARVSLVRQGCENNPCAAFGTVWLDSFDLKSTAGDASKKEK
jgi:Flp pilus assembly protein TadD